MPREALRSGLVGRRATGTPGWSVVGSADSPAHGGPYHRRMNPVLGWALALIAVLLAWQSYGWQGVLFAATMIVFWLLLQFNRAVRVMKGAAGAPVGHVDSAVMLNAKLKRGMTLLQVLTLTKALGRKLSDSPESWAWRDDSGAAVTLVLRGGKLDSWTLTRADTAA
jgi:hypothetical protein